jgi:uncharacterized phage-like protein YoqJ
MNRNIVKEKTCAVTGHRYGFNEINREKLKNIFLDLISLGFDNFLIGMAIGFDTICFQTLENLRKEYKIKITACVPCIKQYAKFNKEQTEEYFRQIENSDEVIILSREYKDGCMQKRNEFMVDNSTSLVAYLTRYSGGTYKTVKYAIEQNKKVIYIK